MKIQAVIINPKQTSMNWGIEEVFGMAVTLYRSAPATPSSHSEQLSGLTDQNQSLKAKEESL